MFKAILAFIKALFTTLTRGTKALDDITTASLFYTETFLQEAYHENDKRQQELDINQEAFKEAVERIKKIN